MDLLNSNPPASVPAPVAGTPEATAAPAVTANAAVTAAPAPAAPVAAAPAATGPVEIPKTTGKTPGGWNRFAGYNPNAAKNNSRDGRGGSKGRR